MTTMETRLTTTLLGDFRVAGADGQVLPLRSRKEQALFAFLAHEPGRVHSRDALAALLWGERADHHARASLRQALCGLGNALGAAAGLLQHDGQQVSIDATKVVVDLTALRLGLNAADLAELASTLELYRGPLLAGFAARAPAFDEWLDQERRRLHERMLQALARLMVLQEREGRLEDAVLTGLRLLSIEAAHEETHVALMRLYGRLGRRTAIQLQYERCTAALRAEMGVEPAQQTRELLRTLTRSTGNAAASAPTPWIAAAAARPFVGRKAEQVLLEQALASAAAARGAVVLLEGEAGIGGTTLLARAASRAAAQAMAVLAGRCRLLEGRIAFAPWLDACRSAGPAMAPLARTLGTADDPEDLSSPHRFEQALEALGALVAERPTLIVFDDFQWADLPSRQLLGYVAGRLLPGNLVVLAMLQDRAPGAVLPEPLADLERRGLVQRRRLAGLGREDSDTLCRERLALLEPRTACRVDEPAHRLWSLCRGHPQTLARGLDELVERGGSAEAGAWCEALVRARLERLRPDLREMAALISVAGPGVPVDAIVAASGLPSDAARSAIAELEERGITVAHGAGAEFADPAHRDVLRGALDPRRLAVLRRHLRIAESPSRTSPAASRHFARPAALELHDLQ